MLQANVPTGSSCEMLPGLVAAAAAGRVSTARAWHSQGPISRHSTHLTAFPDQLGGHTNAGKPQGAAQEVNPREDRGRRVQGIPCPAFDSAPHLVLRLRLQRAQQLQGLWLRHGAAWRIPLLLVLESKQAVRKRIRPPELKAPHMCLLGLL